jgi:Nif-specific regulatory protein
MEMPVGKGIAGLVMQEKRLINVPNVEEDPRFFPLDTDTPKKSLLTAPLMIDGDCIGTLSLNSDQVDAFSADDERLLTTLAAQASLSGTQGCTKKFSTGWKSWSSSTGSAAP